MDLCDGSLYTRFRLHISLNGHHLCAFGFELIGGFLSRLFIQVGDDNRSAISKQTLCDTASDTASSACNEHNLVLEISLTHEARPNPKPTPMANKSNHLSLLNQLNILAEKHCRFRLSPTPYSQILPT